MAEIENTATIRVVADASGVATGLRPAVEAARDASAAVSEVGTSSASAAQTVEASQGRMAAAVQRSTAQIEASERNLVNMVQRMTASTQAGARSGSDFVESLARIRGVDPSGALAPYIAQLRAAEQAQANAAASAHTSATAMSHVDLSAAQINQELRFLPNRFQNIADSITAGQRPMTIFIQQGGELVSSFGGIGAASRAVGGYLLGLVNPLTASAAVAASLAYAFKVGADESEQFKRALILSGNAAGTTSGQLAGVAKSVAEISGSMAGADALAKLVESAKVPAENLQKFSVLAVEAQRVLGKSIEETVGEFAKLGQAPLQALSSFDSKYNVITFAILKQVKALQDQGKTTEAANLAQQAYFDAVNGQKDKVLATLSSWEKAWMGLKMYAADAANWLVDLAGGRETGNFEKINDLLATRKTLQDNLNQAKERGQKQMVTYYQDELDANKKSIDGLRNQNKAEQDVAKSKAETAKQELAKKELLSDTDILLTKHQMMAREIAAVEQRANDNNFTAGEKKQALDIVRKKYYDVYLQDLGVSIEKLRQQLAIEDLIGQRKKEQIQAQLDLGDINKRDAVNKIAQADLDSINRQIAEKRTELAKITNKPDNAQERQQIEGSIAQLQQQRLTREQQQKYEILKLDQDLLDKSRQLYQAGIVQATSERDALIDQVKAQFDYNQEIGLSTTQVAELKAARLGNAAALKDESAAALEAIDPNSQLAAMYREQAQALRDLGDAEVRGANKEQRVSAWKEAVQQYDQIFQQGFSDMLNNGQAGWKSFTKSLVTTFKTSVADQIYKMFARPFVVQMVGSLLGVSQQAIAGEVASQQPLFGGSGVGSTNQAISAAQTASSIYSAFSNGLNGSIGNAITAAGNLFGSSAVSALGSGVANGSGIADAASAYAASGNTAVASSLNAGASIAPYIPAVAAAVASYYGAKAIAGQYRVEGIGGALNYLGLAGGLVNRAFGMGNKEVTSQGISGTLTADTLTGQNYTNWHQNGGWFRSDRNGTDTTALTDSTVKQFTQGLTAIESASSVFAKSLGVSADWIASYSKTFDLKLTGDATKDQQAITDFFSGIGDEIANKLVPNLADFEKYGETASAALERLAGDFQATDQVAQLIGKSAADAFGTAGIESAKAREQLITLAGSASTLTSQAQSYAQNFLTDAEKIAPVQKALDEAMASLGLSTVQTRDQFKAVVNSLDLTTEAGAKEFTSLMALADVFAQVHPATDAAAEALAQVNKSYQDQIDELLKSTMTADQVRALETAGMDASTVALYDRLAALKQEATATQERKTLQDQYDELTMSSAQLLAKQRDALDASNQALFDQIQAVKAQQSAAETAAAAIKAAQDAAAESTRSMGDSLVTSMENAQKAAQALRDFNDSLLLGNLSPLTTEEKYRAAKQQYEANPTDTTAAQAFLQASKDRGVDDFYYQRDFAKVQQNISAGAAAKDAYAASIPEFWRIWQESMSAPAVTPVVTTVTPATQASLTPATADNSALEAKVQDMSDTLSTALQAIADNTAKTAQVLDFVTSGGTAMLVETA